MKSQENKNKYSKKAKKTIHCIDINNCNHNFIKDLIDITPDYSKEIIYCEICEFTPK
jgi:hypothetical protein